jgi:alpha-glucosidase
MCKVTTQPTWIQDYKYESHDVQKSSVLIYTSSQAAVRLDICSHQTVRVWVDPYGIFEKKPSYAVEEEHWEACHFQVSDEGAYIRVLTPALSVRVNKSPVSVDFYQHDDRELITSQRPEGGAGWDESGAVYLYHTLSDSEHYYGLGQDNDHYGGSLDRRGIVRDMITGQKISKGRVTADIPVTYFISTGSQQKPYGMFVDNSYRMRFDMGNESQRYYYWRAEGGELLYYFINAPTFAGVLEQYTWLTGRPSMLPLWALGFIQSKCTYFDWEETDNVIHQMRSRDIPLDAIVFDYDWAEHMMNFRWHPRWKGKSRERIAAHGLDGVHFMLSNAGPMIKKDSTNYRDGVEHGIFAMDGEGSTVTCGHYGGELMDFTAPNIREWLWPQIQPLYEEGIKGWWLDLIEPEGEPLNTHYHGGPKEEIHNVFALLNSKTYYEMQKDYDPSSRVFILGRSGTAGIQKYGTSIWTGDVFSDYETFAAHGPEALNASMSGIPAWTSDAGGFISSTYDPAEGTSGHLYQNDPASQGLLFERWMQFACFSPITRAHHVGPSEPYAFGALVESSARHYLKLRYRLLPYIYSYHRITHLTGSPIMRALVFEYPDDPEVLDLKDQFLFGSELLVAPVFTEFTSAREVYFPQGRWIDYDYGHVYEGGQSAMVYAPQNRIPVFVKSGAIIPMVPEMRHTGEKAWDPICFDIYPDGTSTFTLYQDDGKTNRFETEGMYTETIIRCAEMAGTSVTVTLDESNKHFTPSVYEMKIHLQYTPHRVDLGEIALTRADSERVWKQADQGWYWDRDRRILFIRFSTDERLHYEVNVTTGDQWIPWPAPPSLVGSGAGVEREQIHDEYGGQTPYLYPPATLPCRIRAENFDRGGEKIAFRVVQDDVIGNSYRDERVNMTETEDSGGGWYLAGLKSGSWLEYTVRIPKEGRYTVTLRLASQVSGSLSVWVDERNLSGAVRFEGQGAGTWINVSNSGFILPEGEHVIRFQLDHGELDLGFLEFTAF